MPYDKETRDALQAYYETHDFTGDISDSDDIIYTRSGSYLHTGKKVPTFSNSRVYISESFH